MTQKIVFNERKKHVRKFTGYHQLFYVVRHRLHVSVREIILKHYREISVVDRNERFPVNDRICFSDYLAALVNDDSRNIVRFDT